MVKKLQKLADKQSATAGTPSMAQLFDSQLASSVKDSAQQIWQAGLGAFAKAQGEGGKVFESLVKEGVSIQRRTQAAAEEKLGEVSNRMTKLSDDVQARAGQQWDKLESIFEELAHLHGTGRRQHGGEAMGPFAQQGIDHRLGRMAEHGARVA